MTKGKQKAVPWRQCRPSLPPCRKDSSAGLVIHTARCNIPPLPPSQGLKLTRQPWGPASYWLAPLSRSLKATASSCRREMTFIFGVPRVNVNEELGSALPGFYRAISASTAAAAVAKAWKRLTQTQRRQIRGVSNGMFTWCSITIGLKVTSYKHQNCIKCFYY